MAVLGDECMDAEEFTQILDAGLDAADVAVIPPGYDTVTIGDIERTRLTNIRSCFCRRKRWDCSKGGRKRRHYIPV